MNSSQYLHLTYRQIRLMAGVALILAPVLIILVAWLQHQIILPTLSHYYFAEVHPGFLRTAFTGFLILVGGLMIAYRGFDDKDNTIHNLAGMFSVCVALFPKRCDEHDIACVTTPLWILHAPAAVLMFLAAAYAVYYAGAPTLSSQLTDDERALLKKWRVVALLGMTSGVAAYAPFLLAGSKQFLPPTGILIIEMTGFFGFAFYWLGVTYVIYQANERRAGKGDVRPSTKAAESPGWSVVRGIDEAAVGSSETPNPIP